MKYKSSGLPHGFCIELALYECRASPLWTCNLNHKSLAFCQQLRGSWVSSKTHPSRAFMSRTLGRPENTLWDNTLSLHSDDQLFPCGGRLKNQGGAWTDIKTNLFLYPIPFLMPGSNTRGHRPCAISRHSALQMQKPLRADCVRCPDSACLLSWSALSWRSSLITFPPVLPVLSYKSETSLNWLPLTICSGPWSYLLVSKFKILKNTHDWVSTFHFYTDQTLESDWK